MSKLHLQAVTLTLVFLLATCQLSFPLHFEQSTAHAEQQPTHNHRKLSHYLRSQGSSHDAVTVPSPATPYYMYYFTLPFTVDGTPYKARISTASSTFLIKGPSAAGIPTTKYPCTSCTSKDDNAVFYFDGYASTFDPLYLPVSISSPALNLTLNQSVFVAKAVSPSYEAVEAVLGLAFPSRGLNPRSSFLQNLVLAGAITSRGYGITFNFAPDRSFIDFGLPDSTRYTGDLLKFAILPGETYRVALKEVSLGGAALSSLLAATLDPSFRGLALPKRLADEILGKFNTTDGKNKCGFQNWNKANYISSLKCVVRDFAQLPLLKLTVGASIFELDKSVLIRTCSATEVAGTSNCEVGLEVSETLTNEIIVGTSFFKRFYGYFDQDNREVGLARNKETYLDNGFSSPTGVVAGPTYTKLTA